MALWAHGPQSPRLIANRVCKGFQAENPVIEAESDSLLKGILVNKCSKPTETANLRNRLRVHALQGDGCRLLAAGFAC